MHYGSAFNSPSTPHPFTLPRAISQAQGAEERLAVTGYAMLHAPSERGTGVREMWLRTFDRHGAAIPPENWRTALPSDDDRR